MKFKATLLALSSTEMTSLEGHELGENKLVLLKKLVRQLDMIKSMGIVVFLRLYGTWVIVKRNYCLWKVGNPQLPKL